MLALEQWDTIPAFPFHAPKLFFLIEEAQQRGKEKNSWLENYPRLYPDLREAIWKRRAGSRIAQEASD